MTIRRGWAAGLVLPLLVLSGCERREAREGRQVQLLITRLGTDLREAATRAAAAVSTRADAEGLRRAFGRTAFEEGTPLGEDFPAGVEALVRDLEAALAREPKDAEFPAKAARRVRRIGQWWLFVRQQLEGHRDRVAKLPENGPLRRDAVLTVLSESIHEIEQMEAITARCLREIEAILARG
jgi:hypothetical protein